jgi:hypothetical protein
MISKGIPKTMQIETRNRKASSAFIRNCILHDFSAFCTLQNSLCGILYFEIEECVRRKIKIELSFGGRVQFERRKEMRF